ncbi:DNA-directed RNA polymerase I subunit RPA34.5-domain-containing protein [Chaetomium sp. MPI-CAGE-AT-0009]|nr:DNA-directed RNA polymerase I subunit RPA34.5-domain-containing protein [Chaetomium sp. MPI-CAGE-AT-0009]
MAGPRAPIGTLSQHAATAAGLVRGMVPKMFTRTDPKRGRNAEKPVEVESESESDSDSDSSSGSDTETKRDTKSWGEAMNAKKVASTPINTAKSIKAEPNPTASPKVKASNSTTKANAIKKREASESSAGESSSSDDDEDDKMAVDSESDSEADKKNAKSGSTKGKQKAEEASSESESASSDDESDDDSAPAVKPARKADSAPTKTSASDEESSSEDESDSEGESGSEDEPEPPQKSKSKPAPGSKTSTNTANDKKAAPKSSATVNGSARSKEMVSDAESADTEQSDSDSEDEDETESAAVEKLGGKTIVQPSREIVSQGFHLRKAEEDVDAAAVARAFKKAKAEGKQIWYFTTPKSVPIEVIQKHAIPLDKVHAGKSIFAHEGSDYTGQFEEPVNHAIKVLIPGKTGTNYEAHNQSVDRVLHITRVTRFGEEGESEPALAAASAAVVTKAPRPQPKNLKTRYQPFGVTKGSAGTIGMDASDSDDDVEMAQAPPLNAKSDTPKKAAKKRKHGDVEKGNANPQETASTPVKKSKKARVESSSTKLVDPSPAKVAKETSIAPPVIPSSAAKVAAPEPAGSSPVKKPKGKDKSKKKASAEETSEFKKPAKVTPVLPPAVPGIKSP